jgi:signal transduction histidine kinase
LTLTALHERQFQPSQGGCFVIEMLQPRMQEVAGNAGHEVCDNAVRHYRHLVDHRMMIADELQVRDQAVEIFPAWKRLARNQHAAQLATLVQVVVHESRQRREVRRFQRLLQAQDKDAVEIANQELESFSYSVSHDLRAPLSSIDGFTQVILEKNADALDDNGKRYLQKVRHATRHMAQLIDDLLVLAHIEVGGVHRRDVDLSALVRDVSERLRAGSPGRDARFGIEVGVHGNGDPRLLGVLLDNLLGNAWKFSSRRERTEIAFGCEQREGGTTYFIRDNGAGFDMGYAAKLFTAFQRFHSAEEFEGTGIGLAIVHRVVRRHGGRIWAESIPDSGATFYFTLGNGRAP